MLSNQTSMYSFSSLKANANGTRKLKQQQRNINRVFWEEEEEDRRRRQQFVVVTSVALTDVVTSWSSNR